MSERYDLLLSGGEVIDPSQNIYGRYDVALTGGRVAKVAEKIPGDQAGKVEDVSGKLIIPGLIDLHGHFFYKFVPWAAAPDEACLSKGVTTAVDGGTSGWTNFPAFRDFIVSRSDTRLYCFLNISPLGLVSIPFRGELFDLSIIDVEKTAACIEKNSDIILGVKVRVDWTATGTRRTTLKALELAIQAAERSGSHVMVHIAGCPIPSREIFNRLRHGDVVVHIFNGRENSILDWNHRVVPEVWAAAERGIVFDVAHAGVHIDYNVARSAMEQGLLPHTLSTDISVPGIFVEQPPSMLDVMSIFLALGMPMEEVIRSSTANPAAVIGKSEELGSLKPGSSGDVAVLEMEKGDFTFKDVYGNSLKIEQKFSQKLTICKGRKWKKCLNKEAKCI